MIGKSFTRRDFLKLSGSALGGLFLSTLGLPSVKAAESRPMLGRVAYNKVYIYDIPDRTGKRLGYHHLDEVLDIGDKVTGLDETAYNRVWYHLKDEGYVYSGGIQPVEDISNTPLSDFPKETSLLAEVTVPFADTRWNMKPNANHGYRLYYGTTYWINGIKEDEKGDLWYRVYDDLLYLSFYVRAENLRIVPPEELTPISPDVPEGAKHIIVSVPEQMMAAYEDDKVVFSARVSTGKEGKKTSTPFGGFRTFFKRPAGHMVGGDGSGAYDLPGIPWTSYIDNNGVSFHGTYWHNDFGTPHSHGCINLPHADAKWVYRWTLPTVPETKRHIYKPGMGTTVFISEQPVFQMGWR